MKPLTDAHNSGELGNALAALREVAEAANLPAEDYPGAGDWYYAAEAYRTALADPTTVLALIAVAEAAEGLVGQLEAVTESHQWKAVFGLAHAHGEAYKDGPQFGLEEEAARAALDNLNRVLGGGE